MPTPDAGLDASAWIALDHIPQLGGESIRRLLGHFGHPRAVLNAPESALSALVGARRAALITAGPDQARVEATLTWLSDEHNHLLTLADGDYPPALLEIPDPPPVVYMKGRRDMLAQVAARMSIAVVGSRNATPLGLQNAETFGRALSDAGLTIVSGLAMGIDAAAHRGGLDGQASTIAVVGTGLDLVYPSRNRALAHEIAERGLIISEFSLGTPAHAANFPQRNRIISGLARGVLVVEAAMESGSLITARQAGDHGRDVFAIPGSIHSPLAKGVHQLIKQGAKLVDDVRDILDEFGMLPVPRSETGAHADAHERSNNEVDPVLKALGHDLASVDELCTRTGLSTGALVARLTGLELDGRVAQLPGGKYQRLN